MRLLVENTNCRKIVLLLRVNMNFHRKKIVEDSSATCFISLCDVSFSAVIVVKNFESYRIISYVRNHILVLSDSVCCTVERSVLNQYQQSSLQCLDLQANKVLISLWGKQQILLIIVPFLLSKLWHSLLLVNFAEFSICWTLPVWDQYIWNIS